MREAVVEVRGWIRSAGRGCERGVWMEELAMSHYLEFVLRWRYPLDRVL